MVEIKITRRGLWLLLAFTLPSKRASQRVGVWRQLQRYGSIPLGNSGYLLPSTPQNQERFEWLATSIRKYTGEASVITIDSIDNLPQRQLAARFNEARTRDYQELIRDLEKLTSLPRQNRSTSRVSRLRARFLEIAEVDFFNSKSRRRAEELLARSAKPSAAEPSRGKINPKLYRNRIWVTRSRPGIDRSASAWLIRRFIDKRAQFRFAEEVQPEHVPYDMYHGGFGHRGEDCTFETLQKSFQIRGQKVAVIGEIIHDADVLDDKFGRKEGFGIDAILKGWATQGVRDGELLQRGIHLVEALFASLSVK
jgi:hypothetical protein